MAMMLIVMATVGCKQPEDYKKVRNEVMQFHDVVMTGHAKIVRNQLSLDTLLDNVDSVLQQHPGMDTLKEKAEMEAIIRRLSRAEASMNNWMLKFEPDASDKTNEEAVAYFKKEKHKIEQIDSAYKTEISSSDAYLSKFRKP